MTAPSPSFDRFFSLTVALGALLGAVHCGSTDSNPSEPPASTGGTGGSAAAGGNDVGGAANVGGSGGAAAEVPLLNGCVNPAAGGAGVAAGVYTDRSDAAADRTISTSGLSFTPNCLTIKAGESVTWNVDFSAHPTHPGRPGDAATGATSGSPDSPITDQTGGTTFTATFPTAGFYPFFCSMHGYADPTSKDGAGMVGTIQVLAAE